MIAGLAFQVATLLLFILLTLDFAWRTYRRGGSLEVNAVEYQRVQLRRSWPFRSFLAAFSLSMLLIFTRCVFRVAELSGGWDGHLANTQKYLIGLEGAIIIAAVLLLNLCHPVLCFKDAIDTRVVQPSKRTWYGKSKHGRITQSDMPESNTELFEVRTAK